MESVIDVSAAGWVDADNVEMPQVDSLFEHFWSYLPIFLKVEKTNL